MFESLTDPLWFYITIRPYKKKCVWSWYNNIKKNIINEVANIEE